MGNSQAKAEADETKVELQAMMTALENKLEVFEMQVKAARGPDALESKTEITGGRTAMRVKEIRTSTKSGVDADITKGIADFFDAANASVDGDDTSAKHAAVEGAKAMVSAGVSAIMGVSQGQSMKVESFCVLFMNNAFVRVDYMLYSYSVSAKKWGQEAGSQGVAQMTDLTVLNLKDLSSSEIDFFLSQALKVEDGDFDALQVIKINMIKNSILSRELDDSDLTFEELNAIIEELAKTEKAMAAAFGGLESEPAFQQRMEAANLAKQARTLSMLTAAHAIGFNKGIAQYNGADGRLDLERAKEGEGRKVVQSLDANEVYHDVSVEFDSVTILPQIAIDHDYPGRHCVPEGLLGPVSTNPGDVCIFSPNGHNILLSIFRNGTLIQSINFVGVEGEETKEIQK